MIVIHVKPGYDVIKYSYIFIQIIHPIVLFISIGIRVPYVYRSLCRMLLRIYAMFSKCKSWIAATALTRGPYPLASRHAALALN